MSEPGTDKGLAKRDSYELGKIGKSSIIGPSPILLHSILGVVASQYCSLQHIQIEKFALQYQRRNEISCMRYAATSHNYTDYNFTRIHFSYYIQQ